MEPPCPRTGCWGAQLGPQCFWWPWENGGQEYCWGVRARGTGIPSGRGRVPAHDTVSTCFNDWTYIYIYTTSYHLFDFKTSHSSHGQTKKKLRKFLDAMIQKSGKIRNLMREISEHYSGSDLLKRLGPQFNPIYIYIYIIKLSECNLYISYIQWNLRGPLRSRQQLEDQIQKLDAQYDACNNVMAVGEINSFGGEWGAEFKPINWTCSQSSQEVQAKCFIFQVCQRGHCSHEQGYLCVWVSCRSFSMHYSLYTTLWIQSKFATWTASVKTFSMCVYIYICICLRTEPPRCSSACAVEAKTRCMPQRIRITHWEPATNHQERQTLREEGLGTGGGEKGKKGEEG